MAKGDNPIKDTGYGTIETRKLTLKTRKKWLLEALLHGSKEIWKLLRETINECNKYTKSSQIHDSKLAKFLNSQF